MAAIPPFRSFGRGLNSVFINNGTGFFVDVHTKQPNLAEGAHMGVAFGKG